MWCLLLLLYAQLIQALCGKNTFKNYDIIMLFEEAVKPVVDNNTEDLLDKF